MSQRARYILIIVILLVVIGAGAGVIYYFNQGPRAATGAFVKTSDTGQLLIDRRAAIEAGGGTSGLTGDTDIDWIRNCTTNHDASLPAAYDGAAGTGFNIAYTCENTDPSTAHGLEVWSYDAEAYVFKIPGEQCRDDSTKAAQSNGTTWPAAISQQAFPNGFPDITNWMSQWNWQVSSHLRDKTCADLGSYTNIQVLNMLAPDKKQTIQVPAGQSTITFTTVHEFPTCEWWQYDDLLVDTGNNDTELIMGAPRRAAGQIGSAGCTGAPELGNLEVRMYEDADGNKEYSTPTAGGTDNPFAGESVTITDVSGNAVTGCPSGTTGGAGRISCSQIPVGRYVVKVSNPDAIKYSGPIVDSATNPQPGEQHNATGSEQLTLTVVPGPQPTGTGNDIVTYYDFGYTSKTISSTVGNMEVRIYEDVDKNKEYSTPTAGGTDAPFAGQTVKVVNAAGQDITTQGKCSQGSVTGGAGRLDCWQIPTGKYTVTTTNPDPTKYSGPFVDTTANPQSGEQHNATGSLMLTLTVVPGPVPDGVDFSKMTFFDFGYNPKQQGPIVAGTVQPCVIDKTVKDTTTANEESPDDPKKSVSSQGEQLSFTLAYNCKGTGTATTVPTGTTIVITDKYDDALTTPVDSSISNSGVHDTTQKTINWTLQAGASLTGTVTFDSKIKTGLGTGSRTSTNVVTISRNNEVEDQDQTVTTILAGAVVANNTPPPTPGNNTTPRPPGGTGSTNNRPTTPTTGVGANVAIILLSLLVAGAITAFTMLRLKPAYRRN